LSERKKGDNEEESMIVKRRSEINVYVQRESRIERDRDR